MDLPSIQPTRRIREVGRAGYTGAMTRASLLDPTVYRNLSILAERIHSERAPDDSIDPVGLLHEAWIKLERAQSSQFQDKRHFFAVCARAMRQILMDRARAKRTDRRGNKPLRIQLDFELKGRHPRVRLPGVRPGHAPASVRTSRGGRGRVAEGVQRAHHRRDRRIAGGQPSNRDGPVEDGAGLPAGATRVGPRTAPGRSPTAPGPEAAPGSSEGRPSTTAGPSRARIPRAERGPSACR